MKNRWLIVGIVAVVAAVLVWRQFREKPVEPSQVESIDSEVTADASSPREDRPIDLAEQANAQLENQINTPAQPQPEGAAGIPNQVVAQMKECFDLNTAGEAGEGTTNVDAVLENLQRDMGPPIKQGDLWTDWVVKMKDGSDRKVHLENIEDADGRVRQTIMVFMIDPRGQPFPVPLDPKDKDRPATEVASAMISQGEVSKKERANYFQFARGERLEVIDIDGKPTEVEMVRDETLFRCDSLAPKPSCQCIK